jgi:hypothetical protein
MRRLTDEAVRLLDDLRSGKLENQADFILSECFREAASAFSMINQQLKRDGYTASIDPSIFIWLANITARRRGAPRPCGLRSYPTATKVVRARMRARSLNSSGTLSRGRAAGDRPHMGGVHEVQRKRQFRREGLCLLGADLQAGGTARADADPHFRSRNVKLSRAGIGVRFDWPRFFDVRAA